MISNWSTIKLNPMLAVKKAEKKIHWTCQLPLQSLWIGSILVSVVFSHFSRRLANYSERIWNGESLNCSVASIVEDEGTLTKSREINKHVYSKGWDPCLLMSFSSEGAGCWAFALWAEKWGEKWEMLFLGIW